jgi:hypothetical protein
MRMDFPISPISGTASVPGKRKYVPVRVDRRRGARMILTRASQRIEAESLYSMELVQKTLDCFAATRSSQVIVSNEDQGRRYPLDARTTYMLGKIFHFALTSRSFGAGCFPVRAGAHSRYSTVGTGSSCTPTLPLRSPIVPPLGLTSP